MQEFVYNALPARVIFGFDTLAQLATEIKRLGCSRALILTTPQQADLGYAVQHQIGDLAAGIYTNATMHTPSHVTQEALQVVERVHADCVVSLGGGSTIGLGKAIALNTNLLQIAIPTTYAGSEATPIIGQTEDGKKTTQKTLKVLPEVILYDVELTMTLPAQMTMTSGFNAIAHAVEGLYSADANPFIDALAERGIASIAASLPRIQADAQDRQGRSDALFGAWACGTTLGSVGMGLHHKLCHVLGGTFNTPHAETHTMILPHALAYNASSAPRAVETIARALGCRDAGDVPGALFDMIRDAQVPYKLTDIGFTEADVEKAVGIALSQQYPNPRPLERAGLEKLLRDACRGTRPDRIA